MIIDDSSKIARALLKLVLYQNCLSPLLPIVWSVLLARCFRHPCGKSTVTNLLELSCYIFKAFPECNQTNVISPDFRKAFLILQLLKVGFADCFVKWFAVSKFIHSEMIPDFSGMPSGSHLCPLLFALLLNGLPSVVQHIGDIKLFHSIQSVMDVEILICDLLSLAY